ncbi:glycosyltransferase [uncultured Jannaschia sp.]|uniref:glycosyltransferase n=1 Tax=uncultured Jannaschia sp. TaxID=293347 RepID=UPI00260C0824|nr:glycosyltransferase [uncultured Jannaschia sp.]
MTDDPAVSVLMAVRDGAVHLPETIASLRAQADPGGGLEFVVVDDASTDATPALLAAWAEADPRLRVLAAPAPMGLAAALNLGLGHVRAPLVARADGDDLYAPDRLLRQAAALRADPRLDALSCGCVRIDEAGNELARMAPVTGPDRIRFRTLYTSSLLHPGAMIRTAALRAVGGYDAGYWTAQDSDLWARLLAAGGCLDNLLEPLVRYRVHATSLTAKRGAAGRALSLSVPERVQSAYLDGLPPDHDVAATVDLWQGYRPLAPEAIRAGLAGMERIAAVARRREGPEVLADMRATMGRAFWRQARWLGRRRPALAVLLVGYAVRARILR